MAARTVSELAHWDGRRDRQRQNAKWRRSSSSLVRDPYHKPLENQHLDISQPPVKFSDKRRVQQSAFRPNLDRGSLSNSSATTRPSSRVDTASTSLHDIHPHRASIAHSTPNSALLPSPFITSSKSSNFTPNSSVHAPRVHNSQYTSSRGRITRSQPASIESEVIDLTLEDTEDELSVADMLGPITTSFNGSCAVPGPSRLSLSPASSSPLAPERSLFTPPPPRRKRPRLVFDYVAVPSFPKGLTKADYRPLPSPTATSASPVEPSITKDCTPPPEQKGKEREHDSSGKRYKGHPPASVVDMAPGLFLDAFHEHTVIPLYDDDNYPPLTTLDLATNSRFQFAHSWREHASKLQEAELDWVLKFGLLGKACIWARSMTPSSPRVPGTAGYVSCEQLRPWELALPGSPSEQKSVNSILGEQIHASESSADIDYLLLPDDALPGPSTAIEPTHSNPTVSQGLAVVDTANDMNQYFNGLGDSPAKHVPPRQQLAPTHTFRPHLLQSGGNGQMDSLGLGFPPLDLDSRLADTAGHECFLGVPPSPPPADVEPSTVPSPIPGPSLESVDCFPASPSKILEAPADIWSFKQEDSLLSVDELPSNNHVAPSTPGTIDPSLLGLEQPQSQPLPPKAATPKRRSKLPEPVIYIRRPIDSSSLPLMSGKRPVQIKYRDSGSSLADPPTRTKSNEASSHDVANAVDASGDDTDTPPQKRRSLPSRKLRESHPESDSDYVPETTTTSKIKLKIKRPSLRSNESLSRTEAATVPVLSSCHQCRNTSARPKMSCSNFLQGRICGKRFCNRCILYRYPDITFDENTPSFLCPACTNTCNCSVCSRNRGEEFISMRLGGLAASLFKAKVTLVRDADGTLHRTVSPPATGRRSASVTTTTPTPVPEPGAMQAQSQFWAHVYGMEGERVGSAFMTRDHMERLRAPGPTPTPLPPSISQPPKKARKPIKRDKERAKPKGPRVFIGCPLASWKVRAVRDLEPCVDVEMARGKGKETGTATGTATEIESVAGTRTSQDMSPLTTTHRRRRCYIGKRAPLYELYGRMRSSASPPTSRCSTPGLGSDGYLTPLSEIAVDNWPQPDVGEYCAWAPPAPPGPPGAVVHGASAAVPGAAEALPGPGPPPVGPSSASPAGSRASVGLGMDADVDRGDTLVSASPSTALSEQDLARAISAALAALSVEPGP